MPKSQQECQGDWRDDDDGEDTCVTPDPIWHCPRCFADMPEDCPLLQQSDDAYNSPTGSKS